MRSPQPQRRPEQQRGLRLWPVRRVLVLAFAAAVFAAAAVFSAGWFVLGAEGLKPEHRIGSRTLFDLAKLSFGVVAGAGALVALVVAYRRQRVDEDGALREATRLHTERFTTAVDQLGNESEAVRLGAVHALAGLADDAPTRDLRQTCIDVLCSYLRLPYTAKSDLPEGDPTAWHAYLALREVRHTIIRVIRNHLHLLPDHPHSWQGQAFDFTDVTFDGGDFGGATFSGGTVDFRDATFSGATVNFRDATFSGGTVNFRGATFSGGTVNFRGATFSGGEVNFGGRTLSRAVFSGATVDFRNAVFSDGTVDFGGMWLSGGTVNFRGATFSGATVDFNRASFSGATVSFFGTRFSDGGVNFRGASFSEGAVNFKRATFSDGVADFRDASFSGATVDLSTAKGLPPSGLVPASGEPLPNRLSLPPEWYPTES